MWQSTDPAFGGYLDGKPNGGVFNSLNLGLYGYGSLNPLRYSDPTGRFNEETGEIEKGDTLNSIKNLINQRYHTNFTTRELATANNISNPDKIYAGNFISPSDATPNFPVPFMDDRGTRVSNVQRADMMRPAGRDPRTFVTEGQNTNLISAYTSLSNFSRGGPWDVQRTGPGTRVMPEFIDVATVNIGLYGAAAGIPEGRLLGIENRYARDSRFGNVPMDPQYTNLPLRNVWNTRLGYQLYNSQRVGPAP